MALQEASDALLDQLEDIPCGRKGPGIINVKNLKYQRIQLRLTESCNNFLEKKKKQKSNIISFFVAR